MTGISGHENPSKSPQSSSHSCPNCDGWKRKAALLEQIEHEKIAKIPALLEALRWYATDISSPNLRAREALRAWESAAPRTEEGE